MTCCFLRNRDNMNIAFIGFGKVAYTLCGLIQSPNIDFSTSAENRSGDTIDLINNADIEVFDSFGDALKNADIVVSAVTPLKAVEVANEYGEYCKGIYLDLNNVSPDTTEEINSIVDNLVDGAIIGKIDSKNPTLFLSGKNARDLLFLNDFLNVKVVSDKVGDASKLKLLRSTYTKSLSVLLIETYGLARKLDLEDEFFDTLSITEGDDFRQKSLSRIKNTLKFSKRKEEELEEILNYFNDGELDMVKAALDKLRQF